MDKTKPIRIAVLISGGGRTLKNLIEHIKEGKLPAKIVLVISSNPKAKGLDFAKEENIPTVVIERKGKTLDEFSNAITERLDNCKPDLVCMAGFICFYKIPEKYLGRVMNIHPALLPAFGGKGMYGMNVHRAVIETGCKISGCTVHFADNEYDHGPIILQRAVPVKDDDTPESLADRVFQEEKKAYPEAIRLFAEGRLKIVGRKVYIKGKKDC